jgi:PAS domain S-box-containing protein
MLWRRPGSWSAYLAAILLVVAAILLHWALGPLVRNMPFITFYAAALLAAFLGGALSGLLAVALGTLAAWLLFMPPGYPARIEALGLPNPFILSAGFAAINICLVGALQAALARLRSLTATERARDAQKLQRLADALHNAAFGIAIVDAQTNAVQFANPAFAALRGSTIEQVTGKNVLGFYAPAERTRVQAFFDTADRTGRAVYEAEYVRPDGAALPVQIDISSVCDQTGAAVYRIGTVQDISERKRAEAMAAELHALDVRLRQILDETPIGMVLRTAADARHVWSNATLCRMLEYTTQELMSRAPDDLLHPDDSPTPIVDAHGAVPEWDPIDRRLVTKSGRILQVRSRAIRLGPDAVGQDLVLKLAEDITRQREVEAALRQAQKMEAIGNLAGGMAHDFNNLLGVVIGDLDTVAARLADQPDLATLVKEATEAALRGADLIRNLLAFARRQPLRPTELAANVVLGDITRMLMRVLREDVSITLDLAPALWPVVADRAMLETCIVNLASNARDAMPQGGTLRIATANRMIDADVATPQQTVRPGAYVMIEVTDSGAGMSPEVLGRLFEPFFTTKATDQHSGLGLCMVFGFINQSGGHITVDSAPGSGATVRLFLPRTATQAPETPPAPAPAPDGHGETVLVVEDNEAMRRVAVRRLIMLGYAVIEADSAEAALAQLATTPVRLLFTDVVMPGGMNGFELAQRARAVRPDLKVLLTSGFPEQPGAAPAADAQLLHKPYRAEDLARAVRETLYG